MTTTSIPELVEQLGEALFRLSDRLRVSRFVEVPGNHLAYEAVVAAYQALTRSIPTAAPDDAAVELKLLAEHAASFGVSSVNIPLALAWKVLAALTSSIPPTTAPTCPTCGDPDNTLCSDGFHAPGDVTYWPTTAQGEVMQADLRVPAESVDECIELWFFRELSDEQRRSLISLTLGEAVAQEARPHAWQRLCLKRILRDRLAFSHPSGEV